MAFRCAARSALGDGGLASVQAARRRKARRKKRPAPLQVGQVRRDFDGAVMVVVGMRGSFVPGADLCKFV
jgi:hypothetical protein